MTLDLKSLLESVTSELGIGSKLVAKLPAAASSIEIMRSDELSAAQTGVNLLRIAAYVLTALTLLIYAAAIYLARDRRRETLRSVGISFIVIGVVVLFARKAGRQRRRRLAERRGVVRRRGQRGLRRRHVAACRRRRSRSSPTGS